MCLITSEAESLAKSRNVATSDVLYIPRSCYFRI